MTKYLKGIVRSKLRVTHSSFTDGVKLRKVPKLLDIVDGAFLYLIFRGKFPNVSLAVTQIQEIKASAACNTFYIYRLS